MADEHCESTVDHPELLTVPAKLNTPLLSSVSSRSNKDFGIFATKLAVEVDSRF